MSVTPLQVGVVGAAVGGCSVVVVARNVGPFVTALGADVGGCSVVVVPRGALEEGAIVGVFVGKTVGTTVGAFVARHKFSAISLELVVAPKRHSFLLRLHPHGDTQSTAQITEKHVVGATVGDAVGAVGASVVVMGCSVVVVNGIVTVMGAGVVTIVDGADVGAEVHPFAIGSTPPVHN